jgi:MFS family permease
MDRPVQQKIPQTFLPCLYRHVLICWYRVSQFVAFFKLTILNTPLVCSTLTITNYLPSIVARLNFGPSQALALAGGYITYAPFGNIVCAWAIEKYGRRRMLLTGLTLCLLALIGEIVSINRGIDAKAGQAFAVLFLFVHLISFATFMDTTTFTCEWR